MEDQRHKRRRLVLTTTQIIASLIFVCLFYTQSSAFYATIIDFPITQCCSKQNSSNRDAVHLRSRKFGVVQNNRQSSSLKPLLARFVKGLLSFSDTNAKRILKLRGKKNNVSTHGIAGQDRIKLETTGFGCDSAIYSLVCVASDPVKIDTKTMEIHLPTPFNHTTGLPIQEDEKVVEVRPYASHLEDVLKDVTPVKFLHSKNTYNRTQNSPPCEYNHNLPAVIFSSGGFAGNQYHEFNEVIIPLFITSCLFQSRVQFILLDYRPSFIEKYNHILSQLSPYEILNPKVNTSVHCFPGAVVGLKFHDVLTINSTQVPEGHSMQEFKRFLSKTYSLKIKDISEMGFKPPILILISRQKTRMFLNEDEMVGLMEELGFEVVVVKSNKKMSDLNSFAKLVCRASVLVGTHGAGLSNQVFLPNGAVVVQVVPLGLEWPSTIYFGGPATGMGLRYLDYKIEAEESSLLESYGRDDPVIVDPGSIFAKGYQVGREVYLQRQNVRVKIDRFKGTLVKAIGLLGRTSPLGG